MTTPSQNAPNPVSGQHEFTTGLADYPEKRHVIQSPMRFLNNVNRGDRE
jgi:hypothetical protein